jgi:hypothetical protein
LFLVSCGIAFSLTPNLPDAKISSRGAKMNYIKKLLLVFLAVNVLVAPGFAGLIEDVDNLSPAEAVEFQKKLELKKLEAIPQSTGGAGFVQFINPTQFNNAFPGVKPIRQLYGGAFGLRYPITDRFLIGGDFSGAGNYVIDESSPKVYEDIFFGYGNAQFVVDFRIFQNEYFLLSTSAGAGIMIGMYNYSMTNDNTQTFYKTDRWGSGFSTNIALDARWNVYKGWGVGIGVSNFSGKLSNMRKMLSDVDWSAPDIDLSGTTFRISGSKDF